MELELRHLRVLCAIADSGSVGRAATLLGASQPATSTQLRRIELHFGTPLFERTASGVVPTAFGAEIVAAARDVLARVDRLGRRSDSATPQPGRELRLAATNSPILPGMLARIRHQLPGVLFSVSSVYRSSEIVELLERGHLDAAIAVDYPGMELRHSDAVAHRGIVTEPNFVAISARHWLRRRTEITLADLSEESWILTPEDGAGWPGVFFSACESAGFSPAVVHEYLGDRVELLNMVADGLGLAVVQATTGPTADVLVKPLAGTPMWTRYVLVWRADAVGPGVAEALFDAATAAYRELSASSPHLREWASRNYHVARR